MTGSDRLWTGVGKRRVVVAVVVVVVRTLTQGRGEDRYLQVHADSEV